MSTFSEELTHADVEDLLKAMVGKISGTDSNDRIYDSIRDLWSHELATVDTSGELTWYSQAYKYWEAEENCPITDDGVLGDTLHHRQL